VTERSDRSPVPAWLRAAQTRGALSALDLLLAQQLAEIAAADDETVWLVALLSYQHRQGHVCIDLAAPPSPPFDQSDCPWVVPSALQKSALIGAPGDNTPVILDGQRVYLRRHWLAEQTVSEALRARCRALSSSPSLLAPFMESVFGAGADPWQQAAAANCALHQFGVITGGPGTGKTWTVTRMLALQCLYARARSEPLPEIAMAAPTGKAAARLTEALQAALPGLPVDDDIRAALPDEAVTLHRLLATGMNGQPRYHRDNPLPWDLVVLDEASMIDLGLMAQLVNALRDDARLYLVGDRDQLASVQAGAVFAEVCGDAANTFSPAVAEQLHAAGIADLPVSQSATPLDSAVIRLQTVHRFAPESAIASLSQAVRKNDVNALAAFEQGRHPDLFWLSWDEDDILDRMFDAYGPIVDAARAGEEAATLLQQFASFRVLAAARRGPLGVEQLNQRFEHLLQQRSGQDTSHWYPGQIIMLKQNDWNMRLFNGDIGVVVANPAGADGKDACRVAFAGADGVPRLIALSRVPEWEPAWAMTIHKSQGSEFSQVLLVLPREESPLLTRELLYTAITRARTGLSLATTVPQLRACMARPVYRASGLSDRLRVMP